MSISPATLEATITALKKSSLFSGFDDAALRHLSALCSEESAGDGALLMRQGDEGSFAYILLGGHVEVSVETPLGSNQVAVCGPGEIIGEIAVLADMPRSATVVSRGPVRMVRLEKSALRELVLLRSELAVSIIRELSVRLQAVLHPLGYLMHATLALEKDDFAPELLELLTARAGDVTPFAESFKRMIHALTRRRDDRHEMAIAAGLQTAMLPTGPPNLAGVDVAARVQAAHAVGGDFFDWFVLPDGRLACLVADVSGKGVPAALFMAIARTALRSACLVEHGSVGRIITNVNRALSIENPQSMFVSLFVAVLDVKDGHVEWANAGHPSALLWNGRRVSQLTPTGPILGVDLGAQFESRTLVLDRGNRLFMYTDGISEAQTSAGELFGEDRIIALCEGLADRDPRSLIDAVVTTVRQFSETAEIADDITCLCLDWQPNR